MLFNLSKLKFTNNHSLIVIQKYKMAKFIIILENLKLTFNYIHIHFQMIT